ncbi:hypothetical protein MTR62_10825 [Novosphingobium sp. 1949]|uniref:Flippase-like domain-containing protein n=1 Tax=Novosphingobium organovorum TaxID=2930092 RepID=A0ABT0BDR9_9SPHN|nr:hypothetical protein [Novosphingobium organovorum]MCJ2183182.1 hypothetical protein [Novosphingobium organovorum]
MPEPAALLPNALPATAALSAAGGAVSAMPAITLTPQDRDSARGRNTLISLVLSLAVIGAVLAELRSFHLSTIIAMIPRSPLFWIAFAASYFINPATDWMIFRRLWAIPPAGMLALLRKKVYNELLLGYLGEAYFYTWARRRVTLAAAPFGAIKDVAILSAMTGNAVTVALLAIMLPVLGSHTLGVDANLLIWSLAVILAVSIAAMIFRRRVFSLPRQDLVAITRFHLARITGSTLLNAVLWHLALPQVALSWWLYMATLRLLVSRLPFVPNKDLLFAGVAVLALGHEREIGALMALMAGIILAAHLLLGTALALHDLINPEKKS